MSYRNASSGSDGRPFGWNRAHPETRRLAAQKTNSSRVSEVTLILHSSYRRKGNDPLLKDARSICSRDKCEAKKGKMQQGHDETESGTFTRTVAFPSGTESDCAGRKAVTLNGQSFGRALDAITRPGIQDTTSPSGFLTARQKRAIFKLEFHGNSSLNS